MDRITPGIIAIIIGAIVAVLLFVPFVAASYRLRGRMTVSRTIGWAALLVSFLAIWTYTILPAPAITDDYRCSPPIARWLRTSPRATTAVRVCLDVIRAIIRSMEGH